MNIVTIDGNDIRQWFQFGFKEVDLNRKHLNAINVFPVADGDTGTNLTVTLRAMAERPVSTPSFGSMITSISEQGLSNARGNSGIIFASYVNGLAEEGKAFERVTVSEFAHLAHKAVDYIYKAIEKPAEGTMVTIIKDWASFLYSNHQHYDGFESLLKEAYEAAKISLGKTTEKLEVLKKNHVVDAGAAGFVRFLKGINVVVGSQSPDADDLAEYETPPAIQEASDFHGGYRYCTEILLDNVRFDTDGVKRLLHDLGDSLIVSAHNRSLRIHLHTDRPQEAVARVKSQGDIREQKVDDMYLQDQVLHSRKGKIALVTDSIADLPDAFKLQQQIHMIPMNLLIDDVLYLDKRTIDLEGLFKEIESAQQYPTSSQPEPARVKSVLKGLLEQYDSVIAISVAGQLSGTYRVLKAEADALVDAGKKITVIDSRLNSGAQGLLVKKAAQLLEAGLAHDEVVRQVEALIPRTKIYVCLETIENAIRSGRVPNTVGRFGIFIGARPIMTLDPEGKGAAFGVGFSKQGMTKKIFKLARKTHRERGIESYSIVHARNPELAREYADFMKTLTGQEPEFIAEISAVTAIHSGRGCVAVSITHR